MRRVVAGMLPITLISAAIVIVATAPSAYAAGGPPACWVSWRPSEGSIAFANTGKSDTLMTFRMKWRAEDLTFRTCRQRTAYEMETFFGTSNNRNKLGNFKIQSTDVPRAYIDSDRTRSPREVTWGIGSADELVADHWYTLAYLFNGRLGTDEQLYVDAARGYRLSPCPGSDAQCVSGWTQDDIYGPADRVHIYNWTHVGQGTVLSWSYPARSTLLGKILRHPVDMDAYVLDSSGIRHWIPDGGTYNCLVTQGYQVVNSFAGIDQRWVINSFAQGANATCAISPPPTTTPPPPGPSINLAQGSTAPAGYWYSVTLSGFAPGTSVSVTCRDSVDPGGFYTQSFPIDGSGHASDTTLCYSGDHPDHWVTGGGIESNHVAW